MDLRLIRNATLRVRYGGINLLIDPMLGTCNSIRSLDVPRRNPTIDLPCTVDDDTLTDAGFEHVVALSEPTMWRGIQITPTAGSHGSGPIGERMGHVIGVVLRADDEPTVYWAGDTILTPAVLDTIERELPDLIITHSSGGATNGTKIIMDAADTIEIAHAAPSATIVAVHFEAIAICPITRDEMRASADAATIDRSRLLIPADGDTITFENIKQPQPA